MEITLHSPFRHWGEKGKIYLISDTHFEDGVEKWADTGRILSNIGNTVGAADTIVCLGDCGNEIYFKDISCALKVLIKGNHDTKNDAVYKEVFDEVYTGPVCVAPGLLLSHEPVCDGDFRINIHGHMHTGKPFYTDEQGRYHINVVCPNTDYTPVELSDILDQV